MTDGISKICGKRSVRDNMPTHTCHLICSTNFKMYAHPHVSAVIVRKYGADGRRCGARSWSIELKHGIALTAVLTNSQAALAEKAATEAQEKIDAQALPIRTYLDQTVVPILLQGLSDLVKQRCVFVIVCKNVVSHEECTFVECYSCYEGERRKAHSGRILLCK